MNGVLHHLLSKNHKDTKAIGQHISLFLLSPISLSFKIKWLLLLDGFLLLGDYINLELILIISQSKYWYCSWLVNPNSKFTVPNTWRDKTTEAKEEVEHN